jgi:hypothetical protein
MAREDSEMKSKLDEYLSNDFNKMKLVEIKDET